MTYWTAETAVCLKKTRPVDTAQLTKLGRDRVVSVLRALQWTEQDAETVSKMRHVEVSSVLRVCGFREALHVRRLQWIRPTWLRSRVACSTRCLYATARQGVKLTKGTAESAPIDPATLLREMLWRGPADLVCRYGHLKTASLWQI